MLLQPRNAEDVLQTPAARREAWIGLFLPALRRNQLCGHLDLRLLASRTLRQYISVISVTPFALGSVGSSDRNTTQ